MNVGHHSCSLHCATMKLVLSVVALLSFGLIQLVFTGDTGDSEACYSMDFDECLSTFGSNCGFPDQSSLFSPCYSSQDTCDVEIVPPNPPNLGPLRQSAVQCFCTCISTLPFLPVMTNCCGDMNLDRSLNSTPLDAPDFVVTRLFSPNEDSSPNYRSSSRCNYRLQCPNENYLLYYVLVRQKIEQDATTGQCLDFLRYEFTAIENSAVPVDVCGQEVSSLPQPALKEGFHDSSLTLRFHSNRLKTDEGFFLAGICISPQFQQLPQDCEQSIPLSELDQENATSRRKRAESPITQEQKLKEMFQIREKRSFRVPCITITSSSVVKYEQFTLTVVEQSGSEARNLYRFENIEVFQVYNRIEGFLTFHESTAPAGRTFRGYGLLQIGKRIAQFVQTIVMPQFLLSDAEASIVRDLFHELLNNRGFFEPERYYFTPPDGEPGVAGPNCTWSRLADANMRSCSAVVRAAAQYFLGNERPGDCGSPRNG